jgi:PBP1b-binding outer membrane lipoprotein LpoB
MAGLLSLSLRTLARLLLYPPQNDIMQTNHLLYIFAIALLSGCATATQETETQADTANIIAVTDEPPAKQETVDTARNAPPSEVLKPQSGPYPPECYKTITDIIQSSDFKSDLAKKENIKVRIDREDNSRLFLQLFASEKDHESTIAWLRLDKANEKLEDITVDPDKPVQLSYDKSLISALRQSCP